MAIYYVKPQPLNWEQIEVRCNSFAMDPHNEPIN